MEWKPINSTLMKIRLKGKHININIIQCYAPTNDSEEESKDAFYDQLQAELERTPCHEMKTAMGDLNAKAGGDNTSHDRAMGKEGCGSMNNNGKAMMLNVSNPTPVKVNGEDLPTTEEFTYLGSTVRHDGGARSNIRNRLNKARNAFRMLNVWKSSQYSTKTKLRLYQSCVLSTLLYGSECWTSDDCKRPQPTVHLPLQEP